MHNLPNVHIIEQHDVFFTSMVAILNISNCLTCHPLGPSIELHIIDVYVGYFINH